MATLSRGQTFGAAETITNTKLHNLVDLGALTNIVDADISSAANIQDSKLADITTGNKVRGISLGNLASIPSSAGIIPTANLGSGTPNSSNVLTGSGIWGGLSGINLSNLASIPSSSGVIPIANLGSGTATSGNVLLGSGSWGQNPYLKYSNTQAQNTAGGTATSGSWATIPLTTEDFDTSSIGSLSGNEITLPSGTYRINSMCPFYKTGLSQSRLYNSSDSSVILIGSPITTSATDTVVSYSIICGQFTIASSKNIRLEYQVASTEATDGLGRASNFTSEVYAQIEIIKVN